MPTITYDKKDLIELIGKRMNDEELVEATEAIKPSVEEIGEEEIVIEHCMDRPDLYGVEGLARAIRQYLGISPGISKYNVKKSGLTVEADSVPVRPFVACAVVRNVKLDDASIKSLMNIQEVLHETIGRKRKKVAIGVHDFDKIKPPIRYAGVLREMKMVPLEHMEEMRLEEVLIKTPKGREYNELLQHANLWPVFIDKESIFSFPPIINSNRTKVVETTKNLFIEITGTSIEAVRQAMNILATNLAERGCKIESVKLKYKKRADETPNLVENVMKVSIDYVNSLLGTELEGREMIKLLRSMGLDAVEHKRELHVLIPAYRSDVLHPADVAEDIAIAYGCNNLVPELPNVATTGKISMIEKISTKARESMVGFGFQEIARPILTSHENQFVKMCIDRQNTVEIENPVSKQYSCMRVWLLPCLLEVLAANKHVDYPQKVFEVGDVLLLVEGKTLVEKREVAGAISDSKVGFVDIKAVVEVFLNDMGVQHIYRNAEHPSFIPGRLAEIISDGKQIGFFGEIHPKVLENWNIEMPVVAFELELPS